MIMVTQPRTRYLVWENPRHRRLMRTVCDLRFCVGRTSIWLYHLDPRAHRPVFTLSHALQNVSPRANPPDEEEGVSPLLHTVVDILRLRAGERSDNMHPDHCLGPSPTAAAPKEENEEQPPPQPESPGLPAAPPSLSPAPTESTFLLAFARRNISIERVLGEAESLGLAWRVPDDFEPASASENIYLMSLR